MIVCHGETILLAQLHRMRKYSDVDLVQWKGSQRTVQTLECLQLILQYWC